MEDKIYKNLKILQEKVLQKTGKEYSQEELLDKCINFITQNEAYFFQTQVFKAKSQSDQEREIVSSIGADFSLNSVNTD